jgi:hypothetical protein
MGPGSEKLGGGEGGVRACRVVYWLSLLRIFQVLNSTQTIHRARKARSGWEETRMFPNPTVPDWKYAKLFRERGRREKAWGFQRRFCLSDTSVRTNVIEELYGTMHNVDQAGHPKLSGWRRNNIKYGSKVQMGRPMSKQQPRAENRLLLC